MTRITRRQFAQGLALGLAAAALAPLAKATRSAEVGATPPDDLTASLPPAKSALEGGGATTPRFKVAFDAQLPVHPLLQYGGQAEPDKRIPVFVEMMQPEASPKTAALGLNAELIESFDFVKTHHLELTQRALAKLARNPQVRYISPDGPALPTYTGASLKTTYPKTIGADKVWVSPFYPSSGAGVSVAVIDTGLNQAHTDLQYAALGAVNLNKSSSNTNDDHGHGTHVAGIIAGRDPQGRYLGVAPDARIIVVKVANSAGMAHESELLRGLQWCYDNRGSYNIKVVNISMTSAVAQSYRTSPICAAVEQLWLSGVTVVAAAGNKGTATDAVWYPPANDPFVISVGALDDTGVANALASYSSRGTTQDNVAKPDIVAPGRKIVAPLSSGSTLARDTSLVSRIVDSRYIRLSGTSMAAPVVSGLAALALQRNFSLTPNQIKWLFLNNKLTFPGMVGTAGLVNGELVVKNAMGSLGQANVGLTRANGVSATGAVNWSQAYWDQAYWDQAYWDQQFQNLYTLYD